MREVRKGRLDKILLCSENELNKCFIMRQILFYTVSSYDSTAQPSPQSRVEVMSGVETREVEGRGGGGGRQQQRRLLVQL